MMTLDELLVDLDMPEGSRPVRITEAARCVRRRCSGPVAYRVGFLVPGIGVMDADLCGTCAEPVLDDRVIGATMTLSLARTR